MIEGGIRIYGTKVTRKFFIKTNVKSRKNTINLPYLVRTMIHKKNSYKKDTSPNASHVLYWILLNTWADYVINNWILWSKFLCDTTINNNNFLFIILNINTIVTNKPWISRQRSPPPLGHLLTQHAVKQTIISSKKWGTWSVKTYKQIILPVGW